MFDQRFEHETQNLMFFVSSERGVKKFWDSGGVRVGGGWVKIGVFGGRFVVLEWGIFVGRGGSASYYILSFDLREILQS